MTPGNIIILNGTSTAAKHEILEALQEILDAPYVKLMLEQFISTQPDNHLTDLLLRLESGPEPSSYPLVSSMHHTIASLARSGNHVIAHHALVAPHWLRECAMLFHDLPALLVGVRSAQEETEASPGYIAVHTPGVYDLEVDPSQLTPRQCALRIKERLEQGPPPMAWRWLKVWSDPAKSGGWLRGSADMHRPAAHPY